MRTATLIWILQRVYVILDTMTAMKLMVYLVCNVILFANLVMDLNAHNAIHVSIHTCYNLVVLYVKKVDPLNIRKIYLP